MNRERKSQIIMRMRHIAFLLPLIMAGCAGGYLSAQQQIEQQINQVERDCSAKKYVGQLPSWVAVTDCEAQGSLKILAAADFPDMDAINLYYATLRKKLFSEKLDRGKIPIAEAKAEEAELEVEITNILSNRTRDRVQESEFKITTQELATMQTGARGQSKDLSELMLMQENPEGYRQYKLQKTLEEIEQKNFHCTSRTDDWGNVQTDCD